MDRLLSLPRSVLGALIVLLALNLLGWGIVAYSGKSSESRTQTWQLERSGLLDRQASLDDQLGEASSELETERKVSSALTTELEERQAIVNDLEKQLREQIDAQGDVATLRATLDAEREAGAGRQAQLAADVDAYREKINLSKSRLSARTATLAARDREIANAEERLAALGDIEALRVTIREESETAAEQRAKFTAELEGYRTRINLAKSGLSARTATLAARDREITKAEGRLAMLGDEVAAAEEALRDLNLALEKKDDVERGLIETEASLTSLRGERTTKLAVLGSLAAKIDRQRSVADQELSDKAQSVAALDEQVEKRRLESETTSAELESLEGEVAAADDRLADLQAEREKVEIVLAGLAQRRDEEEAAKGDLEGLRQRIETANAEAEAGTEKLALMQERRVGTETEIARVDEQLAALRDQVEGLNQEVETKETRLAEIEAAALDYQGQAGAAEKRLAEHRQLIDESETYIAALKIDENKTRVMLSGLQAKLAEQRDIRVDLDGLQTEIKTVRFDFETAGRALDERRQHIKDVEDRVAALEADLVDREARLSATLDAEQQGTEKLEALDARIVEAEAVLAEREIELREVSNQHTTRLALLGSLGSKLERQRSMTEDYAATEQRLTALQADVDGITATLTEREDEIALADGQLGDLTTKIEQAEAELLAKANALDKREERVVETEAKLADATAEFDEVQSRKHAIENDLATLSKELEAVEVEKASLEQAAASAEDAKAKAEADLTALQAKLASLADDVSSGQDQLTASLDQERQSSAKLKTLKGQLQALEADLAARKASMDALTADFETRTNDRDMASTALQKLEDEMASTTTALEAQKASIEKGKAELAALTQEKQELEAAVDDALSAAAEDTSGDGLDPLLRAFPVQTDDGVRIAHLLFNYSSAELSPGAARKVNEAAKWIEKNQVRQVRLVGYADAVGTSGKNKTLAEARARVTAAALADSGVNPEAIEVQAVGEDVLVEITGEQVAEPLNRSVGIFVVE